MAKRLALITGRLDTHDPAAHQAVELASAMSELGHEVTLLAQAAGDHELDPRVALLSANIHSLLPGIDLWRYDRYLRRTLPGIQADHVISLISTHPAEIIAPINGTRQAYRQAQVDAHRSPVNRLFRQAMGVMPTQCLERFFERRAITKKIVRCFIAPSPVITEQLRRFVGDEPVPIVSSRLMPMTQHVDPEQAAMLRQQLARAWGLTDEGYWIVFPILDPAADGLETMLRAFKPLIEQGVDAVLLLAGPTRYTHLAWIAQLGLRVRVRFVGQTDRLLDLMAAGDLVVSLSRYDPSGWGVLRAIGLDKPILTTNACGAAAEVELAGGHVLPTPLQPLPLLEALRQQHAARQGATRQEQGGSPPPVEPTLIEAIQGLLSAPNPRPEPEIGD